MAVTIAIAGNPNSGKTCLFNQLTGSSQRVGNYPGVTVEYVEGKSDFQGEKVTVVDLPGTYSLTAYSMEEIVARDYLIGRRPEVIINVVDAANLERNLYLTVQLLELNVPMVLALNMVDVAAKKGIAVDVAAMGKLLGMKVVPIMANRGEGLDELQRACLDAVRDRSVPKPVTFSHELQNILPPLADEVAKETELCHGFPPVWIATKLLEEDSDVQRRLAVTPGRDAVEKALVKARQMLASHSGGEDPVMAIAESRYGYAAGVVRQVCKLSEQSKQLLTDQIDGIVCNRFVGPLFLCGVVYLLFTFVFKCAEELKWLPLGGGEWVSPTGLFELFFAKLGDLSEQWITADWLLSLVKDGIIGGVGGVMSFVPLIFFMFLFIAALEDSGYIARVAFIMDRLLRVFGLQGKSILALIVSGGLGAGGCAVPGVMAARTLREEKDRLITILVTPFMNCGAKMPVYAMLIAAFFARHQGAMMFLLWLVSWMFALGSALVLRRILVRGEQTPFVMELPVYHVPTPRGILTDTCNRTWMYIRKAGTIILAMSVLMWIIMYYPRYDGKEQESQKAQLQTALAATLQQSKVYAGLASDPVVLSGDLKGLEKAAKTSDREPLKHLAGDVAALERAAVGKPAEKSYDAATAAQYVAYVKARRKLDNQVSRLRLENSFAGRMGRALEPVTQWAGFQWRENIALIGGMAAKEVILGTMGTAYAMGNDAVEDELSKTLAVDPHWNRLKAFAMLVFIVGYAPCVATLAAIRKETGKWSWTLFAMVYSTVLAFLAAAAVYQIGLHW